MSHPEQDSKIETNNKNIEQTQPNTNRISAFINKHKQSLIQVYITERQKNKNELGVLVSIINDDNKQEDNKNTFYLPLSSEFLTEEVKQDILSKNNNRNSMVFLYVTDVQHNATSLFMEDLEK